MEDGVDIVVGPQPRYFKLAVSAVSHVPPLEIFVSEFFLYVNFWINRDVGVTVRSVHFMQRAHSVEYLVLNSTNDLLLRSSCETGVAQYDGLGSSSSAITAAAIVSPTRSGGIFLGEAERIQEETFSSLKE